MYILNWIGRLFVNVVISLLVFGFLMIMHMPPGGAGFCSGVVFTVACLARKSITEVEVYEDDD